MFLFFFHGTTEHSLGGDQDTDRMNLVGPFDICLLISFFKEDEICNILSMHIIILYIEHLFCSRHSAGYWWSRDEQNRYAPLCSSPHGIWCVFPEELIGISPPRKETGIPTAPSNPLAPNFLHFKGNFYYIFTINRNNQFKN